MSIDSKTRQKQWYECYTHIARNLVKLDYGIVKYER